MRTRLPKSWFVILALVLVASLGMLFANPMFVGATATNPAAVARLTGLLALVLALSWGVERFVPHRGAKSLLIALPVAALGWWMVSPAFIDVRVDEALPTSSADLFSEPKRTAPVEAALIPAATPSPSESSAPSALSPSLAPSLAPSPSASPSASPASTSEPTSTDEATSEPATASEAPPTAAPEPPTELRRGTFRGLDGHDAQGDAVLYRLEDGTRFIRLEDIDVDNGPGLELHLVPGTDRDAPTGDSIFLGALEGNQGSHNYLIPDGVSDAFLAGDLTVLIWCEPFRVAVGGATLG